MWHCSELCMNVFCVCVSQSYLLLEAYKWIQTASFKSPAAPTNNRVRCWSAAYLLAFLTKSSHISWYCKQRKTPGESLLLGLPRPSQINPRAAVCLEDTTSLLTSSCWVDAAAGSPQSVFQLQTHFTRLQGFFIPGKTAGSRCEHWLRINECVLSWGVRYQHPEKDPEGSWMVCWD